MPLGITEIFSDSFLSNNIGGGESGFGITSTSGGGILFISGSGGVSSTFGSDLLNLKEVNENLGVVCLKLDGIDFFSSELEEFMSCFKKNGVEFFSSDEFKSIEISYKKCYIDY